MATLGPCRPITNDRRPAVTLSALPVVAYMISSSPPLFMRSRYSLSPTPRNTPVCVHVVGATREAAGGANDRDRFVQRDRSRPLGARLVLEVEHVGEQMRDQPLHARMIERRGDRERHAQLRLQTVPNLNGHQRI